MMKLYKKLIEHNLVIDEKDFSELLWSRSIKLNNVPINNFDIEIDLNEKTTVKIGTLEITI